MIELFRAWRSWLAQRRLDRRRAELARAYADRKAQERAEALAVWEVAKRSGRG